MGEVGKWIVETVVVGLVVVLVVVGAVLLAMWGWG